MNERIKQLEEQATTVIEGWSDENGTTRYYEFNKKKFAELIIRECIGCCEQVISDPVPESVDTWLNGGEQCIQEIKQHFGVEE